MSSFPQSVHSQFIKSLFVNSCAQVLQDCRTALEHHVWFSAEDTFWFLKDPNLLSFSKYLTSHIWPPSTSSCTRTLKNPIPNAPFLLLGIAQHRSATPFTRFARGRLWSLHVTADQMHCAIEGVSSIVASSQSRVYGFKVWEENLF